MYVCILVAWRVSQIDYLRCLDPGMFTLNCMNVITSTAQLMRFKHNNSLTGSALSSAFLSSLAGFWDDLKVGAILMATAVFHHLTVNGVAPLSCCQHETSPVSFSMDTGLGPTTAAFKRHPTHHCSVQEKFYPTGYLENSPNERF